VIFKSLIHLDAINLKRLSYLSQPKIEDYKYNYLDFLIIMEKGR